MWSKNYIILNEDLSSRTWWLRSPAPSARSLVRTGPFWMRSAWSGFLEPTKRERDSAVHREVFLVLHPPSWYLLSSSLPWELWLLLLCGRGGAEAGTVPRALMHLSQLKRERAPAVSKPSHDNLSQAACEPVSRKKMHLQPEPSARLINWLELQWLWRVWNVADPEPNYHLSWAIFSP